MDKTYPPITVVNERDEVVSYMDLLEAIAQGCIRRVACVLIVKDSKDILLQRRASSVLEPDKLDFSAGGHAEEGDTYETAARRELCEELGLCDVPLSLITTPFNTGIFFTGVFKLSFTEETILTINEDEVADMCWLSFTDIENMISNTPEQFSTAFILAWPQLRDKIWV